MSRIPSCAITLLDISKIAADMGVMVALHRQPYLYGLKRSDDDYDKQALKEMFPQAREELLKKLDDSNFRKECFSGKYSDKIRSMKSKIKDINIYDIDAEEIIDRFYKNLRNMLLEDEVTCGKKCE
jgi:hypothetical protein